MLSGNYSQNTFVGRRPAGGYSTICLGEENEKTRYVTSNHGYGYSRDTSSADSSYARRKYVSSASSNIFTPDVHNPHTMSTLSRNASLVQSRQSSASSDLPVFLQESTVPMNSPRASISSAESTSRSQLPVFLQDMPIKNSSGSMRDVLRYENLDTNDEMTYSQRSSLKRRESARLASETAMESYYMPTSADNRRRNTQSNVFTAAPPAGVRNTYVSVSPQQTPKYHHMKSSVFEPDMSEHRVTRRYEWSDIFGTKTETTGRETGFVSRGARPSMTSQIVFG